MENIGEDSLNLTGLIEAVKFSGSPISILLFYTFVGVNLIIFANSVTAILTESYSRLKQGSKATHSLDLLEVLSILKYNENYSGIIAALPPFNLINVLF